MEKRFSDMFDIAKGIRFLEKQQEELPPGSIKIYSSKEMEVIVQEAERLLRDDYESGRKTESQIKKERFWDGGIAYIKKGILEFDGEHILRNYDFFVNRYRPLFGVSHVNEKNKADEIFCGYAGGFPREKFVRVNFSEGSTSSAFYENGKYTGVSIGSSKEPLF